MKEKTDRLKKLSCYGMKLEDLVRRVLEVDPKPLWEQEKATRQERKTKKFEDEKPIEVA